MSGTLLKHKKVLHHHVIDTTTLQKCLNQNDLALFFIKATFYIKGSGYHMYIQTNLLKGFFYQKSTFISLPDTIKI